MAILLLLSILAAVSHRNFNPSAQPSGDAVLPTGKAMIAFFLPTACIALFGPRPSSSDPSPWIVWILDVDPRIAREFVGLPREFLQFFEPSLSLRNVLFDREGIRVVFVNLEFLSHLGP